MCTGAILIAIFGAIPEPAHNLDQLLDLLGRRPFVLWMIAQALIVLSVVILAACLARMPSISSKPSTRLTRGLAYGCVSGILSAHSLLVAKSAVELLVRTIIDRVNQFNRYQSWMIVAGLVLLALTQLYYLHQGLRLVSTSVLYPLVFCVYNIVAILDGLIYFRQTDQLGLLRALLIALGTIILLSGVLALSWRLNDDQSPSAVSQSALAPGLGLVEDTDQDDYEDLSPADEAAEMRSEHERLLNGEPMTPRTRFDTVLGATRYVRQTTRSQEVDEIWDELEDHDIKIANRDKRIDAPHRNPEGVQSDADEETALLHSVHHVRRKRRRSSGFPGFTARPATTSRAKKPATIRPSFIRNIFGRLWSKREDDVLNANGLPQ